MAAVLCTDHFPGTVGEESAFSNKNPILSKELCILLGSRHTKRMARNQQQTLIVELNEHLARVLQL